MKNDGLSEKVSNWGSTLAMKDFWMRSIRFHWVSADCLALWDSLSGLKWRVLGERRSRDAGGCLGVRGGVLIWIRTVGEKEKGREKRREREGKNRRNLRERNFWHRWEFPKKEIFWIAPIQRTFLKRKVTLELPQFHCCAPLGLRIIIPHTRMSCDDVWEYICVYLGKDSFNLIEFNQT